MGKSTPVLERFNNKIEVKSFGYKTKCWIWIAYRNEFGYGTFRGENSKKKDGYKCRLAHRWAYEHFVKKIDIGLELDHLCKNKACVNPEHLQEVTHARNMDENSGLRKNIEFCNKGHIYDGDNLYIRRRKSNGKLYRMCRICKKMSDEKFKALNRDKLNKKALEYYHKKHGKPTNAPRTSS